MTEQMYENKKQARVGCVRNEWKELLKWYAPALVKTDAPMKTALTDSKDSVKAHKENSTHEN